MPGPVHAVDLVLACNCRRISLSHNRQPPVDVEDFQSQLILPLLFQQAAPVALGHGRRASRG